LLEVIVITLLAVMAFAEGWGGHREIWKSQGSMAEKVPALTARHTQI
jgi:hypothetical protein